MIAGRYTLDREIGRGGMGAVWCGHDEVLGRQVALKKVGAAPGGSSPDVFRAEREARLAAQLNHPHVVAIFDLVEEDDQHWLVMECIEGTNLAELIKTNGSLSPDEVAPIVAQAADALAAAHAAGIVHRDVKPSNMLVTPEGDVKLTDFGIARAEADAALTQTGLVTGSPAYLSPEVAAGRLATPASDVWSLGASVYHALTGSPPYHVEDNLLGTLYRIVNEDPPRPPQPGWLAPLLLGTMTREPDDRWSAAQVRDFLEAGPPSRRVAATTAPVPATSALSTSAPSSSSDRHATQVLPPPPVVPTREAGVPRRAPRRRTPWTLVALGAAVVLLLSGIAFAIGMGDGDGNGDPDNPGATGSPTGSPSESPTEGPTAEGMEAFVATYLDTVVSDPETAFTMLTPEFQEESGGLDEYLGWWGEVTSTRLESVSADPATLTVQYHYRYTRRGEGSSEEDVTLELRYTDGTYLIAAES